MKQFLYLFSLRFLLSAFSRISLENHNLHSAPFPCPPRCAFLCICKILFSFLHIQYHMVYIPSIPIFTFCTLFFHYIFIFEHCFFTFIFHLILFCAISRKMADIVINSSETFCLILYFTFDTFCLVHYNSRQRMCINE